jgi:hypothetical protein
VKKVAKFGACFLTTTYKRKHTVWWLIEYHPKFAYLLINFLSIFLPQDIGKVMSLPIAWGNRTNSSAPESSLKAERPGEWTAFTLARKYGVVELEDASTGDAPLGWGARSNTKTLEELSQSTSATVIAVAETHEKSRADPGGIFGQPPLLNKITTFVTNAEQPNAGTEVAAEVKQQLESMQSMMTLMSGVLLKMDAKLSALEENQKLILTQLRNSSS